MLSSANSIEEQKKRLENMIVQADDPRVRRKLLEIYGTLTADNEPNIPREQAAELGQQKVSLDELTRQFRYNLQGHKILELDKMTKW